MILPFVSQGEGGGLDILWILLPILCCFRSLSFRDEAKPGPITQTESWFTVQDIDTTYEAIEKETSEWRRETEEREQRPKTLISKIKGALSSGKTEERFVVKETMPPRLHQMNDKSGPVYFELTEVEGGGTVVKTTYNSAIKGRMAKVKVGLPLKIPATPIGNRCPSCDKPVLPEFISCPYCGEKLMKE